MMPDADRLDPPPLPDWLQRMLPFERFRVQAGEHAMHVMVTGEGPPVLLLHGNPTWGFLYRKVATALADAPVTLVMPDLVGLGWSDHPPRASDHTLDHHAGWLEGLVDALDLDRLVFVGQDWGGPIGLAMLARRPQRLAGLVVLNTVLGPPKPGFRPTAFHRFANAPLVSTVVFRLFGFPQRWLHRAQGDRRSISGDVARAYRLPLAGLSRNAAPLELARMAPDSLDHPSIPGLRACQQLVESFEGPTAVVWGDRDPVLGKLRRRTERLLPRAEVTRTDAGHFLQEEVPGEIAAAIRSVVAAAF